MSYKEFTDKVRPEFEKAFKFLESELGKIRTSHASPALVEDVEVDFMGQKYSIKQLAAISTPQTNQIVISPWDASYVQAIEQAILKSGLGMSAAVDGSLIRLTLPMLTQEYRATLTKLINEKAEETRQVMRRSREEAWNKIQAAQKAKTLTEDDKFKSKDELQKHIDEYAGKIKQLIEKKEREIA